MFAGMLLASLLAQAPVAQAPVLPPTPRFRSYGVAEGLPSSRIYLTVQDAKGFVWIGAGDGLARFDGTSFRVWRHRSDDPESIASNDVSALLIDRHGTVWAGGEASGLNRYDAARDAFEHWRHDPDDASSLAGNDVTSVVETADGAIHVGIYSAGVDRLRADGLGFDHLRHDPGDPASLASDNVLTLMAGAEGDLWIGSDAGLDRLRADGTLEHIAFAGESGPLYVWQIAGAGDDIRVATSSGLFVIGADGTARRSADDGATQTVFASLRMENGDLWIAARGELRLRGADGSHTVFKTQPLLSGGLKGRLPFGLMRDRDGALWIACTDAGLAYLGPDWRRFSRFGHVPEDPASLSGTRITALGAAADDRLLVGSQSTLDRFDPDTGRVEHLGVAASLGNASVVALAAQGERTWIGTERDLRVLERGRVRIVGATELRGGVRQLLIEEDGSVLAAAWTRGMVRIDPDSFAVRAVPSLEEGAGAAQTYDLRRVDGAVWRASGAGLTRLREDGSAFEPVAGVEPGWVHSFALAGERLWLARTDMLEAYSWDGARAERILVIDAAAGWPGVDINRMTLDRLGRVWMTSRTGLWCYEPARRSFRRYSIEDGLPSPEFTNALLTRGDDIVYAGTLDGVVAFRSDAEFAPPPPPRLHLGGITVRRDGRVVPLVPSGNAIDLRWNDHDLSVSLEVLSYVDPGRVRHRFRMRGFDTDWVETGNNRTREFTGLGTGTYIFEAAAAGAGHVWSALAPIEVRVATPPWRRPWAWVLYAALAAAFGALTWVLARRRIERRFALGLLEEKRMLAEQASAAKTRFLATLGHEIRTPMTGVLGMAELLMHGPLDERQRGMVGTIQRSGSVLLKLVNDALDLARIEAGKFELEEAPFDPALLLHEVVALESGIARQKGLVLHGSVAAGIAPRVVGDAVRVRQILLNLINNAVKFSTQGEIGVGLESDGERLHFSVADTGPGLDASIRKRLFRRFEQGDGSSSSGSGLGLAICRELVTLMQGEIDVDSEPGRGTTFHVWLPMARDVQPELPVRAVTELSRLGVIVVEDDDAIAAVIVGLLETQGHAVRRAGDALAALAELEIAPCDAMLVDLDLPGMDGFQLIELVRGRADGDRIAILVVTARTARDDEARASAVGADGFLRKPLSGADLAGALARVMKLRAP